MLSAAEEKSQGGRKREDILPIDRPGWGWVVVIATTLLFALHAGGFKCSGVILVELIEKYDGVYPQASLLWVLTVKYITAGTIGPLVGFLIVKLGHRAVAMFGTFMMGVGWIGLAYSNSLITMIACHSLPGGVGNGMMAMIVFLVSDQYFIKWKAMAVAIIASGAGLGTITLPYIMRALYDNYDFAGASLLYGALCLQCMVLAALLRPISYYETIYAAELRELCTPDSSEEITSDMCGEKSERNSEIKPHLDSDLDPSTTKKDENLFTIPLLHGKSKSHNNICENSDKSDHAFLSLSSLFKSESTAASHSHRQTPTEQNRQHLVSVGDLSASVLFIVEEKTTADGVVIETKTETVAPGRGHFYLTVLLMPKFWMISLSLVVYAFGFSVVYQAVPALGLEEGLPKDTVALLMVVAGGLEIPSRLVNGYMADKQVMSNINQYTLCVFTAGFMALLCAIISGLAGTVLVLLGMSTMGTSIFTLIPLVNKDLIGAENVTSAMGVQLTCQACGFIISSYLTGLVYGADESWRVVFYYIAGMMMLSAIITLPYCIYSSCYNRSISSHTQTTTSPGLKAKHDQ